jgi:hypothetical protein
MWLLGIPLALGLAALSPEAGSAKLDFNWQRSHEKHGIAVSRSPMPALGLVAFRAEGRVDAPLLKVAQVISDSSRGTEWVDSLTESRKVRALGRFEFIEYNRFGMPLFVKDRDFVTRVTLEPDLSQRRVTIRFVSVDDAMAPPTRKCVRANLIHSAFLLREEGPAATIVTAEILADPRGALPKWVVNYFQKSWPVATLSALRRQAAKPHVVEHAELKPIWRDRQAAAEPSEPSRP